MLDSGLGLWHLQNSARTSGNKVAYGLMLFFNAQFESLQLEGRQRFHSVKSLLYTMVNIDFINISLFEVYSVY